MCNSNSLNIAPIIQCFSKLLFLNLFNLMKNTLLSRFLPMWFCRFLGDQSRPYTQALSLSRPAIVSFPSHPQQLELNFLIYLHVFSIAENMNIF